jgi:2-polyprenyl-3-methyl-5-hydroxy-6-metoxy-1,4-benzoquinol methylase
MHEYDLIADWYARDRTHLTGLPEVQALADSLAPGASVVDVGCGNGIPLKRFLVEAGFDVLGVDSSPKMLERFRTNLPNTPAVCGKVQLFDFRGRLFDAAISWGVIFHLTPAEQGQVFAKMADVIKPGGLFLFTAADQEGDGYIEGTMDGVVFRYFASGLKSYRDLLHEHGFTLIDTHADRGQNTYYLATRGS